MAVLTYAELGANFSVTTSDGYRIEMRSTGSSDFGITTSNGYFMPYTEAVIAAGFDATKMFLIF